MGPCLSSPYLNIGRVLSRSFFSGTCSTISGQPESSRVTVGVRNAALTKVHGRREEAPYSPPGPEPHLTSKEKPPVFICCLLDFHFCLQRSLPSLRSSAVLCCRRGGVVVVCGWRPEDAIENAETSSHCSLWCDGFPSRGQATGEPSRLPSGFCVCAAFSSCPSA